MLQECCVFCVYGFYGCLDRRAVVLYASVSHDDFRAMYFDDGTDKTDASRTRMM